MPSLCRVTVQNGHHSNEVALNHVLLSNTQIASFISSIIIILFLVTLYYPNCDTVIFNHEGNILSKIWIWSYFIVTSVCKSITVGWLFHISCLIRPVICLLLRFYSLFTVVLLSLYVQIKCIKSLILMSNETKLPFL